MFRLTLSSIWLLIVATIVGCGSGDSETSDDSEPTSNSASENASTEKASAPDSPEAAFKAFSRAMQAQDYPRAISVASGESQALLASGLVMEVEFMEIEDNAKKESRDSLLKKHAVDLSGPDTLLKSVKDIPALVSELTEWLKENAVGSIQSGFPDFGELGKVTVDGEKATAQVDTKRGWRPIEFRKVDGNWVVHLPKNSSPTSPVKDDGTPGIGTLSIGDKEYKLREATAYPAKDGFDKPCTMLLFTERKKSPKQLDAMKEMLREKGSVTAMFLGLGGHIELMLDKDDNVTGQNIWAENVSLAGGSGAEVTIKRDGNRISGKAVMKEADLQPGRQPHRFEVEFETQVIATEIGAVSSDE